MRDDYLDLAIELERLRNRPAPAQTRALELERAISRVERAQREVRGAVSKSDEELAQFHLKLAAGHLARVAALHPGVDTWAPPKKKKKAKKAGLHIEPEGSHLVYQGTSARRVGVTRRSLYTGSSELRFRGVGAEQRSRGVHRPLEVRDIKGGTGSLVHVEGEPIRYDAPYMVADKFGEFEETMRPGVARHLLDTADCRFLFGHDGLPLARTRSGTMRLHDSSTALRFSATIDTRQRVAQDLVIAIERGDVSQMSVGFVVETDSWSSDYTKRSISRFRSLEDVSAVAFPASPSTTISLAGMGGRV